MQTTTRRSPRGAQVVCATLGAVVLTVGVLGLITRGVARFGDSTGVTVMGFGGSPLLNLAHITFGLVAVALAKHASGARFVGLVGTLAFLGFTAYDTVALIDGAPGDPLGIRWPALVLHAVALLASMLVNLLANRAAHEAYLAVSHRGRSVAVVPAAVAPAAVLPAVP